MPPTSPTPPRNQMPSMPPQPQKKEGAGATVGIIIIVILMLFGGLYFLGAYLNEKHQTQQLPLIPGDATTTTN